MRSRRRPNPELERKRRLLRRIETRSGAERDRPKITASNIHYEVADRVQGLAPGGIGPGAPGLLVARRAALIAEIDHHLHVLKRHLIDNGHSALRNRVRRVRN